MKYRVYATVTGGKYLGEIEAENSVEAYEKAWDMEKAHVSLCHHCSEQVEDPEIDEVRVERVGKETE